MRVLAAVGAAGAAGGVLAAVVIAALAVPAVPPAAAATSATASAAPLASVAVGARMSAPTAGYDGVVEALRQTVLAAQVPGAVVALAVKPGDRVKAGQVLLRLDARAAEQQAGAAEAQVQAARAAQEEATRDIARQQQLHERGFISRAALDRAEAQYKSAQAGAAAQLAAAAAVRTESGFYTLKAPYDGIVAEVPVVLGDMALPGRALLTLYDPTAMRVTVALPQSAAPRADGAPLAELPGLVPARIVPLRWQLLPAVDPATHTVQLRLDLPPGTAAAPGMFARAWLTAAPPRAGDGAADGAATAVPRLWVPSRAVVRRAELTGVYVIGTDARPLLRQVRLGPASGEQVEVLAGLAAGERVALEPQAAARVR